VVVPYFNWTGCYLGLNGGYGWRKDHTVDAAFDDGVTIESSNIDTLSAKGWFGGGQVGCNYQAGAAVFGIETDFQGSGISSSFGPTVLAGPTVVGTFTGSDKLKWFGTLRGRLGYAADRVLLYVTGGLAYANHSFEFTGVDGPASFIISNSTTKTGYVLGAGVEWAVAGSWTVKAEYQYLSFGSVGPFTEPVLVGGVPVGLNVTTASHKSDFQTIRIGFNYLFNAAPAAVPVYGK
jgi:outer membrane immunogenic protein